MYVCIRDTNTNEMNGIKSIYLRCTQQAHRLENIAMNDNNNNNADSSASWKMHIAYGDSGWWCNSGSTSTYYTSWLVHEYGCHFGWVCVAPNHCATEERYLKWMHPSAQGLNFDILCQTEAPRCDVETTCSKCEMLADKRREKFRHCEQFQLKLLCFARKKLIFNDARKIRRNAMVAAFGNFLLIHSICKLLFCGMWKKPQFSTDSRQ